MKAGDLMSATDYEYIKMLYLNAAVFTDSKKTFLYLSQP